MHNVVFNSSVEYYIITGVGNKLTFSSSKFAVLVSVVKQKNYISTSYMYYNAISSTL